MQQLILFSKHIDILDLLLELSPNMVMISYKASQRVVIKHVLSFVTHIKLTEIALYHPAHTVENDYFIDHFAEKGKDIQSR